MANTADVSRALIIDSMPLTQSHLKYSLYALGVKNVDVADRGYLALRAMATNFYDLILCSSDIQNGPDGYQLFEQMVVEQLLPNATCFVFLSSEQGLASNHSALELQPDDFILKPFSAKEIESRVGAALKRKLFLRPALRLVDKKNYPEAFEKLTQLAEHSSSKVERSFVLKLKGDLLLKLERWSLANAFFNKLNNKSPSPWSQTAYAQTLVELGEYDLAAASLKPLTLSIRTSLKAHDLFAKMLFNQEQYELASEHYQKAVELSPRNLFRLKDHMELSRLVKDLDHQYLAGASYIRQLKNSIHETPDHYLSAIRAHIDYGFNLLTAEELSRVTQFSTSVLNNLRKTFPGTSLSDQIEVAQARILNLKAQPEKAKKLLHRSLEKIANNQNFITDIEDSIDQAKALHELGFFKESEMVFEQISEQCRNKPPKVLLGEYLKTEKTMRGSIKDSPQELNNKAVTYFQQGNFSHALDSFDLAYKLMPKNPAIALNLMQSAIESNLVHLDKERLMKVIKRCQHTLNKAHLNDEQQKRYNKLSEMLLVKSS